MTAQQFAQSFNSGVLYGCYFTAYRSLTTLRYALDVVRCIITLVVAILYVIEGAHNVLVRWADITVEQHKATPAVAAIEGTRIAGLLTSREYNEAIDTQHALIDALAAEEQLLTELLAATEVDATAELTRRDELNGRTVKQLRTRAKELGMTGTSKLRKAALIDAITERELS